MTAGFNRNADLHLADVLSREIEKTPSGELLAESAEDFGDPRALAREFDAAFARAVARTRRQRFADRLKELAAQVLTLSSWKPVAATAATLLLLVAGGLFVTGRLGMDAPVTGDRAALEKEKQAEKEPKQLAKAPDKAPERPKVAQAGGKDDCNQAQDPGLAIKACSKLIASHPDDAGAYKQRGLAYTGTGDYVHAIADFDQAIKLARHDARGYGMRGTALWLASLRTLDFDEAIKILDRAIADLDEAIRIAPKDEDYSGRGYLYFKKGDLARAVADLTEAIRLNQSSVLAHAWRGEVHEAMGERAKAVKDYNKALALHARTKWESDRQRVAYQKLAILVAAAPVAAKKEPAAGPLLRRVALVIGNAAYKVGPLQTPGGDAAAVAEAFGKIGFEKVILKRDLPVEGFRAALREFARETSGADLAVVYFTGYSIEAGGHNYLIPVDAALAEASDLDVEAIAFDTVLAQAEGAKRRLLIVDAGRSNAFPLADAGAWRSLAGGLVRIEPAADNTLIVYAAKPGTTVDDPTGLQHSPFTAALLKHVPTPGLDVRRLFANVREDVMAMTGHAQQPYVHGRLGAAPLYLCPPGHPSAPPQVLADYAKALGRLEKAAAAGDAAAMVRVGLLYANGEGVPKDDAKAREWFEKAAAVGNAAGMAHLGLLYANGDGVPQDAAKARKWYDKALAIGDAEASGVVARFALFNREFAQALDAAERALKADPELLWIATNRAHALMHLGRAAEAREAYLMHRDKRILHNTSKRIMQKVYKFWQQVIAEDFDELRKAGLHHAQMAEIEGALGIAPPVLKTQRGSTVAVSLLAVLSGHTFAVDRFAFSPDGRRLATASGGTVRVFIVPSPHALFTFKELLFLPPITALAFGPDNEEIFTVDGNANDVVSFTPEGHLTYHSPYQSKVLSVVPTPEGLYVVTAGDGNGARLFKGTKEIGAFRGHDGPVTGAALSPDRKLLLTTSDDKTARVWNAETGAQVAVLGDGVGSITHAAFSPDGRRVIAISKQEATADIWDVATRAQLAALKGHAGPVLHAAFSPDGRLLITASADGTARLWNAETGEAVAVLEGHSGPVTSAVFSPDGTLVATTSQDKTARIWRLLPNKQ